MEILRTVNLSKIFSSEDIKTYAVNSLSFLIKQGEFVSIMGPSGCGKTTLLNIIGLLDSPTSGSFYFKDEDMSSCSETKLNALRKANIGFVFQDFNLLEGLSVYDNISMPLIYLGIKKRERNERILSILNRLKISHRIKHYPSQLSGGQQQRVAIARAIAIKPSLILADEPTGNLDSKNGLMIMNLLSEVNDEGTTVLMVTHSEKDANFSKRIINMVDGKIKTDQNTEFNGQISF